MKKLLSHALAFTLAMGSVLHVFSATASAVTIEKEVVSTEETLAALTAFLEKNNIPAHIMSEEEAEEYNLAAYHAAQADEFGFDVSDSYYGVLYSGNEAYDWIDSAMAGFDLQFCIKKNRDIDCHIYPIRYDDPTVDTGEEKLTDEETVHALLKKWCDTTDLYVDYIEVTAGEWGIQYSWYEWKVPRALEELIAEYNIDRTLIAQLIHIQEGGGVNVGNYLGGDLNEDGNFNVSDVILLSRYTAEDTTLSISTQGMINADFNADTFADTDDIAAMLKNLAGL